MTGGTVLRRDSGPPTFRRRSGSYRRRVAVPVPALLAVLATLAGTPGTLAADEAAGHTVNAFPATPLFRAYVVEQYATANRMEIQWANKAPPGYPWPEGYGERPLALIRLGVEIPFVGGSGGGWGWYVGAPLALEFVDDLFEAETAPVVNTDYWFGMRVEASRDLPWRWPSNVGLRLLPVFHESTHLGDETALFAAHEDPMGHYRINVSYEAWEAALCLDEWDGGDDPAFTLRLGASGRWNAAGYYDIPTDAEIGSGLAPGDFHGSRRNLEWFGQAHVVVPRGFPALGPWTFQGGLELRSRIVFDYFGTGDEQRIPTLGAALGWYRYVEGFGDRRWGFHLRILAGQNPHGQYREQDGYFVFATGFSLGI